MRRAPWSCVGCGRSGLAGRPRRGLCRTCYSKWHHENTPVFAMCHPEEKHCAKGLCRKCYMCTPEFRKREAIRKAPLRQTEAYREESRRKRRARLGVIGAHGRKCVGPCAACGIADASIYHLDHDHSTGAIRGELCKPCNTALGFLGDDPSRVASLLRYINRFTA